MTPNSYAFLPWLRTGLTTRITTDPGTSDRAVVPVRLRVTGEGVAGGTFTQDIERQVQLYGPGDVAGVDGRAISRTEPQPWITNVEPNYLAHIEFYDEDFPWRYSPAPPDGTTGRLLPWLALVVLAGGQDPAADAAAEFTEVAQAGRPLPAVTVKNPAATLPPPDQLGAWAHVHVNDGLGLDGLIASDDPADALTALRRVLDTDADQACSRLMCPRRLNPGTGYHAFLVPAFETGRLAGLGLDPAAAPGALHSGWGPDYPGRQDPGTLPYYHRWYFGTGSAGDFEYLVRLLEPRVPDARVGRRDIDVHRSAGPGLPGITTPAELGGILRLGGALRVPGRPQDRYDTWDEPYPHLFQKALAGLINLADGYLDQTPQAAHRALPQAARQALPADTDEVDPIITPPLYGRWHALTSRLLTGRDGNPVTPDRNWVHRLNLDPRFRIAAGLGTRVVQDRQEELMAAAWAQVGDVLTANARIRAAQLAREVGHVLQAKHLDPTVPETIGRAAAQLRSGRALALTAPANSRVTSAAVPGMAAQAGEGLAVGFQVARSRVTAAPLSPAMRRITRPGSRLMRTLPFGPDRPAPEELLPRMDDEADGVTAAPPKGTPEAVVTAQRLDEVLHPPGPGVAAAADQVDRLPQSADFRITLPGDTFVPSPGGQDSADAGRFKDALRAGYAAWDSAAVGGQADVRGQLDVTLATRAMLSGLRADEAVPKGLLSSVALPERLRPFAERFIEAMAYPVIDLPMYQALLDLSVDLFVPSLGLVPPNTITLLETDQEFIEAFLVGLNHEMARELLWREYPTDQRGSPFRQFWDVRTVASPPGETAAQRRERLYDIRPIHQWPLRSELGHNDNRDANGPQEDELVLVIRGELLRKYPNAAVYAHRARWQPQEGPPDPAQERMPVDLRDPEHPSAEEIRLPLYEAKVEPDLYLLGFDLTAAEAKGDLTTGDAGWFFMIKERPGDPRFGLDVGPSVRVEVWNDLSWPDVDPGGSGFIRLDGTTPQVGIQDFDRPADDQEKQDQHLEDVSLPLWHAALSSADIAYMLFQAPVLMAVHAQEMLL
ncbi:hypothetical protein ACPYPG_33965 [Streptomyces sp. FR-108]|uniref:hypothetical protein n=1 Tax=Streptomyces sp. FR-108 TaxID=3416665 RepID=UPI003CFA5C00